MPADWNPIVFYQPDKTFRLDVRLENKTRIADSRTIE